MAQTSVKCVEQEGRKREAERGVRETRGEDVKVNSAVIMIIILVTTLLPTKYTLTTLLL